MSSLDIHLIAIGGTGMAPLACLLQELGHRVRGSDGPLYPPMSTLLADAGIEPAVGYGPENLEPRPDLVIVGNAVPRTNPEAETVERLGLDRLSMPEALFRFFLAERKPLVVAGTHGKTTTTSIAAWVYAACERDPSYLIGGVPLNFEASFHLGSGDRFIIEGDEYNAAYFDRGPKFLHYAPETLLLTSVEYDHADLYPDHETLLDRYVELVSNMPESGHLVACGDSADVRRVAERASCRVTFYGLGAENDVRPIDGIAATERGSSLTVAHPWGGPTPIAIGLFGEHNVSNVLAVFAAAARDGIVPEAIQHALGEFRGVKRRMEIVAEVEGVTIIDDFAHHPTAVGATLEAARQSYPERRIVAAYEPRSLTAGRDFLHDLYLDAFARADRVYFAPIFHHDRLGAERLDLARLTTELREIVDARPRRHATATESHADLVRQLTSDLREGDVLLTMSSGSFEGLPRTIASALEDRVGVPTPAGTP